MRTYLADYFKENLAKKREEFLRLRSKITLANEKKRRKRKSKEEERRRREKKSNGCTLSLYIGYFGLTEEVYLAERFQESARFRQVVISLLKKLTKSKGGSRKITSRYFGSNNFVNTRETKKASQVRNFVKFFVTIVIRGHTPSRFRNKYLLSPFNN